MTIESEFDNMINIPFSVVIRQNKKKCYNDYWCDFLQSLSLKSGFLPFFHSGKKKKTKQILSASQGIEIFRFKGKTVRRTG